MWRRCGPLSTPVVSPQNRKSRRLRPGLLHRRQNRQLLRTKKPRRFRRKKRRLKKKDQKKLRSKIDQLCLNVLRLRQQLRPANHRAREEELTNDGPVRGKLNPPVGNRSRNPASVLHRREMDRRATAHRKEKAAPVKLVFLPRPGWVEKENQSNQPPQPILKGDRATTELGVEKKNKPKWNRDAPRGILTVCHSSPESDRRLKKRRRPGP